jgi:hypothetical protein
MTKLLDLPNELLGDVAAHLATDFIALHSLCACSCLLRDIAQPWLYSCVRIPLLTKIKLAPLESLQMFHRTITERPDLASCVKEVSLNDASPTHQTTGFLDDQDLREFEATALGADMKHISYQSIGLVIQIFSLVPNVEHIALVAGFRHPQGLLLQLHHRMRTESSFLSKLRSFHLQKDYEKGPVNIRDYIPFFDNPSFEELTTRNNVDFVTGHHLPTNTLTRSSSKFYWAIISPSTLDILLRSCTSHNMFCFVIPSHQRFHRMEDVGYYPQVFPEDFARGLLKSHGSSLTTLHVDFYHGLNFREPDTQEDLQMAEQDGTLHEWYFPSFHGFEKLSHMTIEFEKLRHLADLPVSLEELTLDRCYFFELDENYLRDLLRLKSVSCPNIRSVVLRGFEDLPTGIEAVQRLARSLDVHFFPSENRRELTLATFMRAGFSLQLQSCVALPMQEDGSYDEDEQEEDEHGEDEEDVSLE